ncbi:MAG: aminopeptidase [Theionarchaea archaeon]|nr:aminopeptidase [Theionarchaea archaeon]
MEEIARFIVNTCLNLNSKEDVLIVCDHDYSEMARAFAESLFCAFVSIPPLTCNGEEPPPYVARILREVDAVIALTTLSLGPTDARKRACDNGVRFISMAGISEKSLQTIMKTDYALLEKRASELRDILENGSSMEVFTGDTCLTMSIEGRHPLGLTGTYTERGAFGTLPEGEVLISPVEKSVRGSFTVDIGMVGLGFFDEPLLFHVDRGMVISIEGQKENLETILNAHEGSRQVAEVAVGINPAAACNTIFEAKKVEGTGHISLGDNHTIGGVHRSGVHMDGVISSPTIMVDGEPVVRRGDVVV